jgi:hypothetical protein
MGKEGRRFLPNLKKLGSPRLNLDEAKSKRQNSKSLGNKPKNARHSKQKKAAAEVLLQKV